MAFWNRRGQVEEDDETWEGEDGETEEEDYEDEGDAAEESAEDDTGLIDYDVYVMSAQERLLYIVLAAAAIFGVGMIFYHNFILAGVLSLLALRFPKIRTGQIIRKRKRDLTLQFKDLLYALSSSMDAENASIENAFVSARHNLEVIYPDPNTYILQEVDYILHSRELGAKIEDTLEEFAERAHLEDITNFSDVIRTCRSKGGEMAKVTKSTSQIISDKIETKEEIETLLTGKRYESRIMSAMPIFMVAILSVMSPDYMAPVFDFSRVIGPVVMTVAIGIFTLSFFWSERIMDIEV